MQLPLLLTARLLHYRLDPRLRLNKQKRQFGMDVGTAYKYLNRVLLVPTEIGISIFRVVSLSRQNIICQTS